MIGSMDAENLEYFLLGDINVDLLSTATSPNRAKLVEIFDIYGLEQMIKEPTRVTAKSSTLIDLCITIVRLLMLSIQASCIYQLVIIR